MRRSSPEIKRFRQNPIFYFSFYLHTLRKLLCAKYRHRYSRTVCFISREKQFRSTSRISRDLICTVTQWRLNYSRSYEEVAVAEGSRSCAKTCHISLLLPSPSRDSFHPVAPAPFPHSSSFHSPFRSVAAMANTDQLSVVKFSFLYVLASS